MELMQRFREDVLKLLSRQVPRKEAQPLLERPPESVGADLAFPCFLLAKKGKKPPGKVAHEISGKLKPRARNSAKPQRRASATASTTITRAHGPSR